MYLTSPSVATCQLFVENTSNSEPPSAAENHENNSFTELGLLDGVQ